MGKNYLPTQLVMMIVVRHWPFFRIQTVKGVLTTPLRSFSTIRSKLVDQKKVLAPTDVNTKRQSYRCAANFAHLTAKRAWIIPKDNRLPLTTGVAKGFRIAI
jgi:hypothetical protein